MPSLRAISYSPRPAAEHRHRRLPKGAAMPCRGYPGNSGRALILRRWCSHCCRMIRRRIGWTRRRTPCGRRRVRTESRAPRPAGFTSHSKRTSNSLEVLVAAQRLGRLNTMVSVVDHPTPSSRILNRVPNPIGPAVSFSTSSSFGFHSGSQRTSVQ
jgi:hypothetical protein